MALYESKFERIEESFLRKDILKAIYLANKVISRRTGIKIYTGQLPIDFMNSNGKFSGLICLIPGRKMIRYNWRLQDSSCTIVSIDFWLKGMTPRPTYTLETESLNVIKLIDTIVSVLQGNIQPEYQVLTEAVSRKQLEEDFNPKTKGTKSTGIANALKQWANDMDIDDNKLETTKIAYLYKDFSYWYNEIADPSIEPVTDSSFRNYILNFLKDRGLKNIYVRSLKLKTGGKEKIIVTDKSSEAAYLDIEHLKMNVSDLRDFMGDSLRAVARGYQNSLIIAGKAGVGKTTITKQVLKDEKMDVTSVQQIRNIKVLYNLFIHNNDPKKVILFDDTTDLFDKKYSGYLSAALDDKKDRIISFPSEVGKDMADFAKFGPNLNFKGKVVILTNVSKNKIPTFLRSRSITIEVQATNEEMADDIRKHLMGVLPEVSMGDKIEVLDFIEQLGQNVASIDYRSFKLAVIFKMSDSPDWKKRVYALLK